MGGIASTAGQIHSGGKCDQCSAMQCILVTIHLNAVLDLSFVFVNDSFKVDNISIMYSRLPSVIVAVWPFSNKRKCYF